MSFNREEVGDTSQNGYACEVFTFPVWTAAKFT